MEPAIELLTTACSSLILKKREVYMINMNLVLIIAAFWGSLTLFVVIEYLVRAAYKKNALRHR